MLGWLEPNETAHENIHFSSRHSQQVQEIALSWGSSATGPSSSRSTQLGCSPLEGCAHLADARGRGNTAPQQAPRAEAPLPSWRFLSLLLCHSAATAYCAFPNVNRNCLTSQRAAHLSWRKCWKSVQENHWCASHREGPPMAHTERDFFVSLFSFVFGAPLHKSWASILESNIKELSWQVGNHSGPKESGEVAKGVN